MNHDEHESTTAYAVGNVGSYSYEFLQNYTSEESLQYTYTYARVVYACKTHRGIHNPRCPYSYVVQDTVRVPL